jgi:hypothetical protein
MACKKPPGRQQAPSPASRGKRAHRGTNPIPPKSPAPQWYLQQSRRNPSLKKWRRPPQKIGFWTGGTLIHAASFPLGCARPRKASSWWNHCRNRASRNQKRAGLSLKTLLRQAKRAGQRGYQYCPRFENHWSVRTAASQLRVDSELLPVLRTHLISWATGGLGCGKLSPPTNCRGMRIRLFSHVRMSNRKG